MNPLPDHIERRSEALRQLEQEVGQNHRDLIPLLDDLAYECHSRKSYELAEESYKRALTLRGKLQPQDHRGMVNALHGLGLLMRIQGRYAESEPYYTHALDMTRATLGAQHLEAAERQNYLAGLYFAWGRYRQAADLIQSSVAIYRAGLGDEHHVVGVTSLALALALSRLEEHDEALEAFRTATRLIPAGPRGEVIESFSDLAGGLLYLAKEKFKQGKIEEAETLFRYSLVTEWEKLWPGHPMIADNLHLLGDLYRAQRMTGEAEFLYRRALEIRQEVFGTGHLDVAQSAAALGALLHDSRRFNEAEQLLGLAVEIRSQQGFPPVLANTLRAYAACLRRLDRAGEAAACEKRAEQILERYTPQTPGQ